MRRHLSQSTPWLRALALAMAVGSATPACAGLLNELTAQIGADLMTPFRTNPCHDDDLAGRPCATRGTKRQQLQLDAFLRPRKPIDTSNPAIWRLTTPDICSPGPADDIETTPGPMSLRLAASRDDALLGVLGIDPRKISGIEIRLGPVALYARSSRGLAARLAAGRETCTTPQPFTHAAAGLVSAPVTMRLDMKASTPADVGAAARAVAAALGDDMDVIASGAAVIATSRSPVFLGIAVRALVP
jgi:hypothetical protein